MIMAFVLLTYFSIGWKLDKLKKRLKNRLPTFEVMTTNDLIALYEKFYFCQLNGGYVKLTVEGETVIARISDIKSLTHGQDRAVTLEAKDINGQPVKKRTFKLSDLKEVKEVRLLDCEL